MERAGRHLELLAVLALVAAEAGCAAKSAHRLPLDPKAPRSVAQAVEELKTKWLKAPDRDWILRNPKEHVGANLHLPFGTAVRNEFGLWGRNPELLASCGVTDPETCSGIIFSRLWESVREDADPKLVQQLDCQFRLIELIRIRYAGFYKLRIGEILEGTQAQIDQQLPAVRSHLAPECESVLILRPTGDPDLACWSRVEFSEDGQDPVSLQLFLGWVSWRNGFSVLNSPPEIDLPFNNKCAWPTTPAHFQPATNHGGTAGEGPYNNALQPIHSAVTPRTGHASRQAMAG